MNEHEDRHLRAMRREEECKIKTSSDIGHPGKDMTCELDYKQLPDGTIEVVEERLFEPTTSMQDEGEPTP